MILWLNPIISITLFIPIVGLIIGFFFFFLTISLQYMYYPMSNHKIKFAEQRALQAKNRLFSLRFGGAIMGASMILYCHASCCYSGYNDLANKTVNLDNILALCIMGTKIQ